MDKKMTGEEGVCGECKIFVPIKVQGKTIDNIGECEVLSKQVIMVNENDNSKVLVFSSFGCRFWEKKDG